MSHHLPAMNPELLDDQARVHAMINSRNAILAASPSTNLHQDAANLVHKASAAHALSRKLLRIAEGTQDEGSAKFIETAAGRAEGGARALAYLSGAKTGAAPPHEVVWESSFGLNFIFIFGKKGRGDFL